MRAHIGALIEIKFVLQGEHMAIGVNRDPGMVTLLARMVRSHQVLAPVLDPFDRPLEPHCRQADEKVFRVELAADAEPAAGIAFLQYNTGRTAAEHARQAIAVAVRHLGRAIELQHIARAVVTRQGAARFQRHAAVPADFEVERDNGIGRGKRGIDLAIAFPQDQRFGREARREAARRRGGIQYRRELFGLDRDKIGGIFREIRVGREYRGHRLADIAQSISCQQRLPVRSQRLVCGVAKIDRRQIGDIGRGPHRHHARRRQRHRAVDAAQQRMRIRRAHHPHMELMRERDIADELSLSSDQRPILEPRHRAAENSPPGCLRPGAHAAPPRNSANAARTAAAMFW